MGKHFDFDKFMEEKKKKSGGYSVTAFGKSWELPSDIPYDVVLETARLSKMDQKDEVDEMIVFEMAESLCGKENVKSWKEHGIGVKGMMYMFKHIYQMYMIDSEEEADEIQSNNP